MPVTAMKLDEQCLIVGMPRDGPFVGVGFVLRRSDGVEWEVLGIERFLISAPMKLNEGICILLPKASDIKIGDVVQIVRKKSEKDTGA